MKAINFKKISSQNGAAMVEYALVLGLVIAIFLVANQVLLTAVSGRSSEIAESHSTMVGCTSEGWTGVRCL